MPGILPMKVIKVGTSAQIRIAQACDRCRSKKIRCDGIRPCCSQCANVGFECKTSDKLSRRAFPRGYTESLEERVRVLEGEVRELKDLLDEKDEKIDMLSRMHNNRAASQASMASSPVVPQSPEVATPAKEDTFRLQASPLLLDSDTSDSPFMGASTGRTFVDAFKRKLRDNGKSCSGFNSTSFLLSRDFTPSSPSSHTSSIPPRLFSDRCINIFWQEHAPLFPVLHKPTFLRLYEEYVANPEDVVDNHKLAMLHLVFSIAGFSTDLPDKEDIAHCEEQWRRSLNAILLENTLSTLQCLILACLYCSQTGDYRALQTYKAIAVGLSQRLGLHQSQKRFSFGALTIETRKKVFWTLYTVDCFSAASMGLPQLLQDSDIETEYPVAIDDEYVEEKGYLPTLPGQSSKISSALALFRASRILSKILQKLYPANPSQDLSLQAMSALEAELDEWSENLPQHLKLTFVQDKPSTDVTGSRSALLSLAYYHIRSLLHRPAIGSTLGDKASPSVISLANSSKHLIQIIQLLEERSMSFSFCISKPEMLTLCGLSLLYQSLDLKKEGPLLRDGQRLIHAVSTYLTKLHAPGAADFQKLVASLSPATSTSPAPALPDRRASAPMAAPRTKSTPSPLPRQMLMPASSRYPAQSTLDSELLQQQERMRRASLHSTTIPVIGLGTHARAVSLKADAARSDEYRAAGPPSDRVAVKPPRSSASPDSGTNLDYLPLHATPRRARHDGGGSGGGEFPRKEYRQALAPSEWESLLSSLDSGTSNIFDAVYGGAAAGMGAGAGGAAQAEGFAEWEVSPQGWDAGGLGMPGMGGVGGMGMGMGGMGEFDAQRSVLSFSEESLSSGDEFVGEFGMGGGAGAGGGLLRAEMDLPGEGAFYLEGLEVGFGLS